MVRHNFTTDTWYAAKLVNVVRRPVENMAGNDFICLLRLEFEIFMIFESLGRLHSRGELASCDLVVGKAVREKKDPGLARYVNALGIERWHLPESWEKKVIQEKWIKVRLSSTEESTYRNPFCMIKPFQVGGYVVIKAPFDLTRRWVSPDEAAHYLGVSTSTIRRRAEVAKKMGFEKLEYRTEGGHRRLDMKLLWNIWEQIKPNQAKSKNA